MGLLQTLLDQRFKRELLSRELQEKEASRMREQSAVRGLLDLLSTRDAPIGVDVKLPGGPMGALMQAAGITAKMPTVSGTVPGTEPFGGVVAEAAKHPGVVPTMDALTALLKGAETITEPAREEAKGRRQRKLEETRTKGDLAVAGAKAKGEAAKTSGTALGKLTFALGDVNLARSILDAVGPDAALGFAEEAASAKQKSFGAKGPVTPEMVQAHLTELESLGPQLNRAGIKLTPEQANKIAQNADSMDAYRRLGGSSEIALMEPRRKAAEMKLRVGVAIERLRNAFRGKLALQNSVLGLANELFGQAWLDELSFDPETIKTRVEAFKQFVTPMLEGQGANATERKAIEDIEKILSGGDVKVEAQVRRASKEEQEAAPKIPTILKNKGMSEEYWNRGYQQIIEAGGTYDDALRAAIRAAIDSKKSFTEEELLLLQMGPHER